MLLTILPFVNAFAGDLFQGYHGGLVVVLIALACTRRHTAKCTGTGTDTGTMKTARSMRLSLLEPTRQLVRL